MERGNPLRLWKASARVARGGAPVQNTYMDIFFFYIFIQGIELRYRYCSTILLYTI